MSRQQKSNNDGKRNSDGRDREWDKHNKTNKMPAKQQLVAEDDDDDDDDDDEIDQFLQDYLRGQGKTNARADQVSQWYLN